MFCKIHCTHYGEAPYPADAKQAVQAFRFAHGVSQLPVEQVLPGKDQETEAHGHQQHVEDSCHVVDVQLGAHHLVFLILADA